MQHGLIPLNKSGHAESGSHISALLKDDDHFSNQHSIHISDEWHQRGGHDEMLGPVKQKRYTGNTKLLESDSESHGSSSTDITSNRSHLFYNQSPSSEHLGLNSKYRSRDRADGDSSKGTVRNKKAEMRANTSSNNSSSMEMAVVESYSEPLLDAVQHPLSLECRESNFDIEMSVDNDDKSQNRPKFDSSSGSRQQLIKENFMDDETMGVTAPKRKSGHVQLSNSGESVAVNDRDYNLSADSSGVHDAWEGSNEPKEESVCRSNNVAFTSSTSQHDINTSADVVHDKGVAGVSHNQAWFVDLDVPNDSATTRKKSGPKITDIHRRVESASMSHQARRDGLSGSGDGAVSKTLLPVDNKDKEAETGNS